MNTPTPTPELAVCFDCGTVKEASELAGWCEWCGQDCTRVTAQDLPRLDEAWADDRLDDMTYERIVGAFREAIAEENREAEAREAAARKAGKAYLKLRVRPVTFKEACAFIDAHHRHHRRPQGWKFGYGLEGPDGELRGVVCVGRPVARMIATQDPQALEVTRCCVLEGTPNGASMLYGVAWRAARKLGCTRLLTYILESEPGISLRAAGWSRVARSRGGGWDRPGRSRTDKAPTCAKWRWEKVA
jgi:hypothetical protein